jgi:hypothetical protein
LDLGSSNAFFFRDGSHSLIVFLGTGWISNCSKITLSIFSKLLIVTIVKVTVSVMLEISENQRHLPPWRDAKNSLAPCHALTRDTVRERGNAVAIWKGLFVACH